MAFYEYQCEECHATFTVSELISEHEKHEKQSCPECGSERTHRVLGSFFAKTASKS
jgi:putative FmdB family regulatory protein